MQLLTVPEAARVLRIGEETMRKYLRAGKVQAARRVGRRWLIPDSALAALVDTDLRQQ
jgi:excisionase family DNA binding protein